MRLSLILIFATFLSTAASVYSQAVRVNLDLKNATLEEVFQDIQNQTDFDFFYKNEHLPATKIYNESFVNERVDIVLDNVLDGTGLIYRVLNKDIVITKGENSDSGRGDLFNIQQQNKTVTGKIVDESGLPLPGVTVAVKGTSGGTITNADGDYTLNNISDDAVLVFSFVGLQTQEISVSGRQNIDVTLIEQSLGLDEVIVIGYGTARRQDFTGSVSSIKMENSPVSNLPNLNALESLKGNISGLNIGASNSAGGQPSMIIRGQNSINGDNDPLIVLDGVIYMGSLSDINPNDIASYDILKDAVSAAVYGSRSANGVIAITTKRGSSSKPVITFNTSAGIQTWQNRPVMMKGEQWIEVVNARNQYPEGSTTWMKTGELENLAAGRETNWLDAVTQTGVVQDYQLSVSGAAKGLNYYLSSSYNDNKGVVLGDEFNRISILGKINTDITSWLKIGVDAGYSRRDYSGFAADIGTAQMMSPYGVMYRDDNGNLEKYPYTQSGVNPLWGVNDNTRDNMDILHSYRLNSYAVVEVPWVKGLNYRINYSLNLDQNRSGEFYYEDYFVAEGEGLYRYEPSVLVGFLSNANGNLFNSRRYSYVWDNIITYKNKFDKHSIEGTLVATRDFLRYEEINSTGSDFAANGSTTLGKWGLSKATVQKVNLDAYEQANIGYLGRASYSFADKYYVTGSYRRDGASVFGSENKWADFAAAGLAWRISKEDFMSGVTSLDELKLKVSWGQNGNQGIAPYTTLSQVANGSSGGIRYEFSDKPGIIYYGLIQSSLGNQSLGWESTESWNTGFESAWLKNRLYVDVDLYFSKTTDQIFERNIPVMTGFKTVFASMGQVNNAGIEMTVRSINMQRDNLNWTTQITFWKNKNKLVKLYGEDNDGDGVEDDDIANSLFIGKSLDAIYGYKQDGIVQEDDTEYISLTGAAPGAPKYVDTDGVDGITAEDRVILGYKKENFRLNMSNSVTYKNFEFYALLTGVFGGNNNYLLDNTQAYLTSGTGLFNANMTYKPYWTPENKSNVYPSAPFSGDGRFRGLQSRGFVRLQDITVSYTFSQQWMKDANINSLKVFLAAKNVFTITNWDGGDPETGATYMSNTFPVLSTYSIGAAISF
ncbi:SusC/RagA family TonB-linked outer membrane protein [Maribellus maritimus]|uniref:SusC/RagA family TonB-linked outer membrane protein n=1 Tax=Maribellus maritimus TaxID=2870838 RepID=UPI001EEA286B|nr:TonB-dependent receptor [Maribellus maritimus]MCG6187598.1 TonB-dependent receptor [Maribellus maritimus]